MSDFFAAAARPRVLVSGLSPDEIEAIRPICGSLQSVTLNGLSNAHPEEHDVLITTASEYHERRQFPLRIVFAPPPVSRSHVARSSGYVAGGNTWIPTTSADTQSRPAQNLDLTEFTKAEGLSALVTASCVPPKGEKYSVMPLRVFPERCSEPFLIEHLESPQVLASIFEQGRDEEEGKPYDSALWLPDRARAHLPDWLRWVFARWRVLNPASFPESAEWETSDEWASAEELEGRAALAAFDKDEAKRLAEIESRRLTFTRSLETAALAGDDHRQLLKATGESLEKAVATALRALEFEVVDADALPENQGYKKEDLRVSDGEWVAIVEVKGYTKAGKSNDLQQVNKAAKTFLRTTGREADAIWLVVNSFREMDPAQRPLLIPDRPDEIATFAEDDHGLIIDTRELFKLWQAVTTGALEASVARAHLRASTGRFGFVGADTATDSKPELSTEQTPE